MSKQTDSIERRTYTVQHRNEGESRTVVGMAALYNSETDLGWFRERIEPGAFDEAIGRSDVRALFNHDANHLLARTKSGTLELRVTDQGLEYEFDLPNTTTGNDMLEMMQRGDLDQSSFAFTVRKQRWEEEKDNEDNWIYTRVIEEIDQLFDVSPVTYPAYKDTTVALRSFEQHKLQNKPPKPNAIPLSVRKRRADLLNY